MKIKDYKILSSESRNNLEKNVKSLIKLGWEINGPLEIIRNSLLPHGFSSFTISPYIYLQNIILK